MAPAELIPSSSDSGGDDSFGGGGKQKKVPQRGLGVAQLERIRVEEERKREAAKVLGNGDSISSGDTAPCIALQCPSLSSTPPNFRFRSPPSIPIQIPLNGGVEEIPLQSISNSGNGGWCRLSALRFFHFQPPASPLLNSSSIMEPPSNQNIHANNYASSWPEEFKMFGVKRAYPFSLESPPPRCFACHFDRSRSRFNELPSCSSIYTAQMEPRSIRISSSKSREVLNGDFLTLAPPSALSPSFDNSSGQGFEENRRGQIYASGQSRQRDEAFSFFPVMSDIDERDGNGGKGETIDLNLKL